MTHGGRVHNESKDTKNSLILDVDTMNRNWEKLKVEQAFRKYFEQLQGYKNTFHKSFFKFLESSNFSKNPTLSAYNQQKTVSIIDFKYSFFNNPNMFALNKNQEIYCIKYIDFVFRHNII